MKTSHERPFAALSREAAFVCDSDGVVTWADERSARLLGLEAGMRLTAIAVPGTEEKLCALLARCREGATRGWEIAGLVQGTPVTLSISGAPHEVEGEIALVASLVSHEYGRALAQVHAAMAELAELHRRADQQQRALDESGRGVVALHAELDEKVESLHRVTESRSRVVANVSHEFRTPVNSILGLTRLLLSREDGELTDEQERQVRYIRRSAEALSALANDLLDLSKIEAGRLTLRSSRFAASELFGALRGMLRPLAQSDAVELVFDDPDPALELETDEAKLSQILRNLVSNALKFTERGSVRVSAARGADDTVCFVVRDTGIGIDPCDHERIFEEFVQLEGPLQTRARGTGLGLSLARGLADMLGGEITLESALGVGSTFTLALPRVHSDVRAMNALVARSAQIERDASRAPVLVVEDDRQTLFLYEKYLEGSGFHVVPVRTLDEARAVLARMKPAAVVLDVMLEGETSWSFLSELKSNAATRAIPALVVTVTNREQRARALGADEFFVKPLEREWLLTKLRSLARTAPVEKVLVIDDDEVARYLVRELLDDTPYTVLEASSGHAGVAMALRELPQVILLDFVMPDLSAFEVLDELKRDPRTRSIPVIVNTSKELDATERARLSRDTAAILSKQSLSREVAIGRIREALANAGVQPLGRA